MHRRHRLGTTLLLLAVAATVVGCAEQQDPVDRVEAYALPKTMFAGEWYYNKTVIDTPSSESVAFIGQTSWGSQFRIRWDIQENYLYARTAYELIAGAAGGPSQDTGEYKGTIVGAWKISSHFDIKKGYNLSSGEPNNTLMENSEDCVWYNCKLIRVDWSTNHATDANFLHWGFSGSIVKEAMPFYVQDQSDRDYKPVFDAEAGYLDVTTALAIKPKEIFFRWYNISLPVCWLRGGEDVSCQTEIVKVRHSFMRKAPNRDYEPRLHRGEQDEWFGYFVSERFNWHSEQGMTYRTKKHYMLRHNIWEKNHDSTKACTKDADCGGGGSRCDTEIAFHKTDVAKDSDHDGLPDDFENATAGLNASNGDSDGDGLVDSKDDADGDGQRNLEAFYAWDAENMEYWCTVPMNKRVPKPIVYFTTGPFPKSMRCDEFVYDVSKDTAEEDCKPWKWSADKKTRADKWSAMHYASVNYEDNWWKVYLRGAYGWSDADYQKWVTTHDPAKFSGTQRTQLDQFGDKTNGYYSFAICPNNPVAETDAWPCRFPQHSFAQAKELMDRGLKFNHMSFELAKARLDANQPANNARPYVRIGDMRYSYVNWVKVYSPTGPLGYGPNTSDVRTGEIISGYANIYPATDYVATRIDDLIAVLNGEMKANDYIDGVNIRAWLDKVNAETTATQASTGTTTGFTNRAFTPQDVASMYSQMKQPWMKKIAKRGTPQNFSQMHDGKGNQLNSSQIKIKLMEGLTASGLLDRTKGKMDLSIIKGTPLERRLIDEEVLLAAGYRPDQVTTISEDVLDKTSIARGGLFGRLEAREEFLDAMRKQGVDFAEDFLQAADEGLTGLSARLKTIDPKKRWAVIRDTLTRPLVVHEMGHSLGLMHNFGGSEDVVNYHPEYWKLRTNDGKETAACTGTVTAGDNKLCPFYLKPMNDYQLGKDQRNISQGLLGLNEYSYTSVMDYDRYSTMMGLGLGRYDTASFIYGYTDKVEVYKSTGKVPLAPDNIFDQWHEGQGTVLLFNGSTPKSFHYTKWYTLMGENLYKESNRELVDYREMKKVRDSKTGTSQGWFHVKGNTKRVRVPYIYCTHGRSNISGRCMTWDWGADFYERMKMHVDNWDTWYVLNSFPRGRVGWSKGGYIGGRYGRFYKRLKHFNNTYALYQTLFNQWYSDAEVTKFFTDPVDGWGDYTVAMHDGFNTLMQTLAMPDVKSFDKLAKQNDGQEAYNESTFGSEFQTNVTNARYFSTSYYNTDFEQPRCGSYWWECLHHFGFYMEKVMAMYALADPRTYFVGQDTAEDMRLYRINFFDNFSTQIVKFFSAMLAEQHADNSPWFDPTLPYEGKGCKAVADCGGSQFKPTCFKYPGDTAGECQFKFPPTIKGANNSIWVNGIARRNYADPTKDAPKPATGGPVEASTRFTLQLYGAVMGMFLFQGNYDNAYAERGRMWKKGKDTTWVIKPTAEIIGPTEYTSPYTGATYVGIQYKDGKGIAQRAIDHANALKARSKYCSTIPTAPDACVAGANQAGAEFDLKIYADLLDVIVQVTTMYDERL
jgi:hypothetical protein